MKFTTQVLIKYIFITNTNTLIEKNAQDASEISYYIHGRCCYVIDTIYQYFIYLKYYLSTKCQVSISNPLSCLCHAR